MAPLRLIVADRQTLFREALAALLQQQAALTVVGHTGDIHCLSTLVCRGLADLVVSEIQWGSSDVVPILRNLLSNHPRLKLVFLSCSIADWHIDQALRLRAHGYLCKLDAADEILRLLRAAAAGRTVFSQTVASRLASRPRGLCKNTGRGPSSRLLTVREQQVLRHVARGEAVKEVARRLNLSFRTVANHKANLMRKLDIHDRVQLARFAWESGALAD